MTAGSIENITSYNQKPSICKEIDFVVLNKSYVGPNWITTVLSEHSIFKRFEVLAAVKMSIFVLWAVRRPTLAFYI
jgi:hypothetical protein